MVVDLVFHAEHALHAFHANRDFRLAVGLEFRHGDEGVCLEDGLGNPDFLKELSARHGHGHEVLFVPPQNLTAGPLNHLGQSGGLEHLARTRADMLQVDRLALSNQDAINAVVLQQSDHGLKDTRIGHNRAARRFEGDLNQVGFNHHGFRLADDRLQAADQIEGFLDHRTDSSQILFGVVGRRLLNIALNN